MLLRARVTLSVKPCDLSLFLQWLAVRTKVHAVEPEKNLRDYNHICRTEGFRDHLQDWQREEDILLKKYVNIAFSLPPSLPLNSTARNLCMLEIDTLFVSTFQEAHDFCFPFPFFLLVKSLNSSSYLSRPRLLAEPASLYAGQRGVEADSQPRQIVTHLRQEPRLSTRTQIQLHQDRDQQKSRLSFRLPFNLRLALRSSLLLLPSLVNLSLPPGVFHPSRLHPLILFPRSHSYLLSHLRQSPYPMPPLVSAPVLTGSQHFPCFAPCTWLISVSTRSCSAIMILSVPNCISSRSWRVGGKRRGDQG